MFKIVDKQFKIVDKQKIFDKVTRIKGVSQSVSQGIQIETDVHDDFFTIKPNSDSFNFKIEKKENLEHNHDYIMRGTIFKKDLKKMYLSFNGLLMEVDNSINQNLKENDEVYCYFDIV